MRSYFVPRGDIVTISFIIIQSYRTNNALYARAITNCASFRDTLGTCFCALFQRKRSQKSQGLSQLQWNPVRRLTMFWKLFTTRLDTQSWLQIYFVLKWDWIRFSRERFAVCVKSLLFPLEDKIMKLVEWIELNLHLGVAKIIIYVLAISKKLRSVLEMYKEQGQVI